MRLLLSGCLSACVWLVLSTAVYAFSGPQIQPTEVQAALLMYNWRPDVATRYTNSVHVEIADLSSIHAVAVIQEACPATRSKLYVDTSIAVDNAERAARIEHEFHHLVDYEPTCSYRVDEVTRDYFSLRGYRSVDIYSRLPQDYFTQQHYNHDLIFSVGYDISKLPDWYADKYFWYMQPPPSTPVLKPIPVEPTPTSAPALAPRFKVMLPRLDLKLAT